MGTLQFKFLRKVLLEATAAPPMAQSWENSNVHLVQKLQELDSK